MKTMACLISHQHVPNLLAVQAVKPDRLVLLVTPAMKGKEADLLRALSKGNCDYASMHDIIEVDDENSIQAVYAALDDAYKKHPDDEWIVNLTGGTKPMSIGAYAFSKDRGPKTLYIAAGNQHHAIDLLGGPSVTLDHHVSTAEFLAGYGFDLQNADAMEKNEREARNWIEIAAALTAHHEDPSLQQMLGKLQNLKKTNKNGLTLSDEDGVSLKDAALRSMIARDFHLTESGTHLTGHLDKHAVEFLTGKWLEVFVWSLFLPFVNQGIWDLHLGAIIAKGNGPGENNEFDVSFMQDQSLSIVECKTGEQEHDPSANSTLYKIEAIKSGLTAIRMKTYLATTSPNVIDPDTRGIRKAVANRCSLYGCTIVHGEPLREMAELFLRKDPSLHERVAATFCLKMQGSS